MSKAGVAFASARSLESGTSFLLSFWLPETSKPCTAEGTVVYCTRMSNNRLYRIGARLQLMSQETQERIVDFVTSPTPEVKAGPREEGQA
jgi:hypothetical protein